MARKLWTPEEDQFLRDRYDTTFTRSIAEQMGRSCSSVRTRAKQLGLKKTDAYILQARSLAGKISSQDPRTIATRFTKGSVPANKGKKMPPEVYAKAAPTMFKKGQMPHNHKPVGSERIDKDGYIMVKVAEPKKWKQKQRVVWEEAHGPIPNGYNIQFKDGNRQNVSLDNLYIISRSDQLKNENSMMARYPEELQKVIRAKGALKAQITWHNKRKHETLNN